MEGKPAAGMDMSTLESLANESVDLVGFLARHFPCHQFSRNVVELGLVTIRSRRARKLVMLICCFL